LFAELLLGRAGETEIVCASGRYDLGDISNLGNNREVVLLALLIDITGFCESSDQVIVHARRKSFVQFAELGDSGNGACAILTSDFQALDDGAYDAPCPRHCSTICVHSSSHALRFAPISVGVMVYGLGGGIANFRKTSGRGVPSTTG